MISIALIGGTGTGKSTVAAYLKEKYDAQWLDCDAIGHRLLDEPGIQSILTKRFGKEILDDSSTEKRIDRKKLGAIVFRDDQALSDLNAIIHPPIMEELKFRQEVARRSGVPFCVLDGALLMDVNVRQMVDEVWAITADKELRIDRLMTGRQIAREKAEQIMKNQISPEEYAAYADRVISTDLGKEDFSQVVDKIIRGIYEQRSTK